MRSKILVTFLIVFSILAISPASFAQEPAGAAKSPLPPTGLVADVKDDSSVKLTWTLPIDTTVAGFNVYRAEDQAGKPYEKVNGKLLTESTFIDKSVKKGTSYTYVCRSVNTDGIESINSNIGGAPRMKMNTSATVTHMGKTVRIATPGDIIKYSIGFTNQGFGIAKNVVVVYAIPKGTTFISGTARCPKYKAAVSYFDEKAGKWVSKVSREENISKVRFTVLEDVLPAAAQEEKETASLKVMVNY